MTDNEIIQALEYCFTNDFGKTNCNKCAFYTATAKCMDDMQNAVIDLINRQREEIERLQKGNKLLSENADTAFQDGLNEAQELYALQVEGEIKSEAIKDFAERLCKGRVSNDPVVIAVRAELKEMDGGEE